MVRFVFPMILGICLLSVSVSVQEESLPEVKLSATQAHPFLACSPVELKRLRAAWKSKGPGREIIAARVKRADRALAAPLDFPPEGGQHNQWYQCDGCQRPLVHQQGRHVCSKCRKVYSGYPYDNVLYSRHHRTLSRGMEDAAWAYAITGDLKYARHAAAVLKGYADRYLEYPYHSNRKDPRARQSRSGGHVYEQTLNEAGWTLKLAAAYDLVHESGVLGAKDHALLRDRLFLPVLKNIAKHRAGKSNWQSWHNAAMLWGGAVLGEAAWVNRALRDPKNGFHFQMKKSVLPGGMWYENSWGYHAYTLTALVHLAEGARRLGIDLYGHPVFRSMLTLPFYFAMPGGVLPRFGDDVNTRIRSFTRHAEPAFAALKDPLLIPGLSGKPTWQSILLGISPPVRRPPPAALESRLFPGPGHAILRSRDLTAAITFGPPGGFHGHFDKLSFVLFGKGRELGVDPGRARSQAYRLPVHRRWYRSTLSHNTVLVDFKSQCEAQGKCEFFGASGGWTAVCASCYTAYPNVRHRRLLCLGPEDLIVVDDLKSLDGAEHDFTWVYHNRGEKVVCDAASTRGGAPKASGFEYVRNVFTGEADDPVKAVFPGKEVTTRVQMAVDMDARVLTGDGRGASADDRVPLMMVTRRGKEAFFVAAIRAVETGQEIGWFSKIIPAMVLGPEKEMISLRFWPLDGKGDTIGIYFKPDGAPIKIDGKLNTSRLILYAGKEDFQRVLEVK